MLAKEISVKRYVVGLSGEERERLETLLRKGKSPAQRLLKARILLKEADVSEAGEGWSDSRIIKALGTSVSMIYRVRKQLVEEGFEVVLSRKQRATPAVARIFDGEKEAKLGCSIGRSAGLAPCKIRCTYQALRVNRSERVAPYAMRPPASTFSFD